MLEPGLRSLLAPTTRWQFFEAAFGRSPAGFGHPPDALSGLIADLGGLDLAELLAGPRRPEVTCTRVAREDWFTTLDTDEALEAYAAGFTLYFHVGQLRPRLLPWVGAIAGAFALPLDDVDISLFASPPGTQTPLHYDASDNLTLQLRGHKRWSLGANRQVEAPLDNWVPGTPAPPSWRPGTFAETAEGPVPEVDLEPRTLGPGEGLYVPSGHWHTVESLDHSLAMTWAVTLPRVRDRILAAYAAHLDRQADLRAPELGAAGPVRVPGVAVDAGVMTDGLDPALWGALAGAPDPRTPMTLEVALAAAEVDEVPLPDLAWITLYRARHALAWSTEGAAAVDARLRDEGRVR